MNKFSERLKELRVEKNLTTRDLSKLIDISHATISRWENGINDVKGSELIKLSKFFRVTTDYLLGLED